MEVEFSEEACATRKAEMPPLVSAVKMRRFTPITPTIERPVTWMIAASEMLDMPLMGFPSFPILLLITEPVPLGLKVFLTLMGMFFTHTG